MRSQPSWGGVVYPPYLPHPGDTPNSGHPTGTRVKGAYATPLSLVDPSFPLCRWMDATTVHRRCRRWLELPSSRGRLGDWQQEPSDP